MKVNKCLPCELINVYCPGVNKQGVLYTPCLPRVFTPVIHLGAGENCDDLAKLLSNSGVSNHHLKAVRAWLEKRNPKPGGES